MEGDGGVVLSGEDRLALAGQCLKWTTNRLSAECRGGGGGRYKELTREHLFKRCLQWRP